MYTPSALAARSAAACPPDGRPEDTPETVTLVLTVDQVERLRARIAGSAWRCFRLADDVDGRTRLGLTRVAEELALISIALDRCGRDVG